MMKQSFLCFIIVTHLCKVYGMTTESLCGDGGWVSYKDEKCLKIIKRWATKNDAEDICNQQSFEKSSYKPTLVSIKSEDEQDFLTYFIFNTSEVKINVWIGAERMAENSGQFVWNDGSDVSFTNWDGKSPSEDVAKRCVEMQSTFMGKMNFNHSSLDRSTINGKWKDVTCEAGNWVVCQKLQTWSFPKLQKTLLDTRKSLIDQLDDTTNKLDDTKNKLDDTTKNLEDLQRNPVPIGFIYVQLPAQPEPGSLWPNLHWGHISSDYAGDFFRIEGGNSSPFGETQEENSQRMIEVVHGRIYGGTWASPIQLTPGVLSTPIWSGANCCSEIYGLQFKVSAGEVRPRNKAVRIWKRLN